MTLDDLTPEQKDDLLRLTKKALQLACMRLAAYEGSVSPASNPEQWIALAHLREKNSGWELKK